jgi:transglutaminase-like putative cysteine protease
MGQMKRRFYIMGLGLLVLVIALAGLLTVLNTLSKPTSDLPPVSGDNNPDTSDTSSNPDNGDTGNLPVNLTPDIGLTPDFQFSLPNGFSFNLSNFTDPGLALSGETPPHYPLLAVSGAGNTKYLKSITSSYFDGKNWQSESSAAYNAYNGGQLSLPNFKSSQPVTDTITVDKVADIAGGEQALPTSQYPVSVNSPDALTYSPESMTFLTGNGIPDSYTFTTTHFNFTKEALTKAQPTSDLQYLQMPGNITPRTVQLAKEITSGITSPYYKAKAIEEYLKTNYTYDYEAAPAPAGREPNDWFLFEEKRGVCTNFNSAFVMLARAAGLPARIAGGFAIKPQDAAQTVYADQAHAWAEVNFKELGWVTFDATGSTSTKRYITKTEITAIEATATKGKEFTVSGTVWTDTSKPADGTMVEILINTTKSADGAIKIGEGLAGQGFFKIQAVIPGDVAVGNYQVIAHSLESPRFQESWSDPALKVISNSGIKLSVPPRGKIGIPVKVDGLLSGEFGEPLASQSLSFTVNNVSAHSVFTDNSGRFTWQETFTEPGNYAIEVYFAGSNYYLTATARTGFRIVTPAVLTLEYKDNTLGEPVYFSGSLKETAIDEPLDGRNLTEYIDGDIVSMSLTTDDDGAFGFETAFMTVGKHRVKVVFNGDDIYAEASATVDLDIVAPTPFPAWKLILIIGCIIAAGIGGWLLYRWLKNRSARAVSKSEGDKPEEEAKEPEVSEAWQSASPGISLTIELPQITPPLPDVWGVDEELHVVLRLNGDNGAGMTGSLQISLDGKEKTIIETGNDGTATVSRSYAVKGTYKLTADYNNDEQKASVKRPVRVVDYREEIVALFNDLVEYFRAAGIPVSDEDTPRKIQYLVLEAKNGIPEKALEDAVACFEETEYSLHRITRQHYVTMYMAQLEIRNHGN